MQSQRFLLFYTELGVGGVETLIVRFSNWLARQGHGVTLVLMKTGELSPLLDARIKLIETGESSRVFRPGWLGRAIAAAADAQVALAFDPMSLWMLLLCRGALPGSARVAVGVYHPRIYVYEARDTTIAKLSRQAFIKLVPAQSMLFMNEPTRAFNERLFGVSLQASQVFPLPIEDRGLRSASPKRYKIVSIGRLTAFKTYNLYMIDIVHSLRRQGWEVSWEVYGSGELEDEMRRRIAENDLADRISLHGNVEYTRMGEVLQDAYAFVGMGTALVEAAYFGIPSIPAIDLADAYTYGYFHQLPGHAVGERLAEAPGVAIERLLADLFGLGEAEYRQACLRTRQAAGKFSIDAVCGTFAAHLDRLALADELGPLSARDRWLYYLSMLHGQARRALEAGLARLASSLLKGGLKAKARAWNRRRRYVLGQKNQSLL